MLQYLKVQEYLIDWTGLGLSRRLALALAGRRIRPRWRVSYELVLVRKYLYCNLQYDGLYLMYWARRGVCNSVGV
jgi:hypothetical protein